MILHADLGWAIKADDPEPAEQAMREHLAASRQLLQASI
jgi:DNA-binding FadR family transcriptional regulator